MTKPTTPLRQRMIEDMRPLTWSATITIRRMACAPSWVRSAQWVDLMMRVRGPADWQGCRRCRETPDTHYVGANQEGPRRGGTTNVVRGCRERREVRAG
jgi:hypothetical protein